MFGYDVSCDITLCNEVTRTGVDILPENDGNRGVSLDNTNESEVLIEGRVRVATGDDGALVINRGRPRVSLVTLSGGIDSVYTLVKLLRETDDVILAHHVHMMNREGRHRIEAERTAKIVAYCKNTFRDFHYTESAVDRRQLYSFGIDTITVAQETGSVCKSFTRDTGLLVDRWLIGFCIEEKQERDEDPDGESRRRDRLRHRLNAVAASCYPLDPPEFEVLDVISKLEEIEYIGPELTAMCWTCRTPIYADDIHEDPVECGECSTCLVMAKVRESLATDD